MIDWAEGVKEKIEKRGENERKEGSEGIEEKKKKKSRKN